MKTTSEMIEGPDALKRFENTMEALFSTRKDETPPLNKTGKRGRTKKTKPRKP